MKKVVVAELATITHKGNYILKMELIFIDTQKLTKKHSIDISRLSEDGIDVEIEKDFKIC